MPSLEEVLGAIENFGPEALEAIVKALCGCDLSKLPIEALTKMGVAITEALAAKNEKVAMQDAVKAIDAEMEAEQKLENNL